jgi:hypothetical protein
MTDSTIEATSTVKNLLAYMHGSNNKLLWKDRLNFGLSTKALRIYFGFVEDEDINVVVGSISEAERCHLLIESITGGHQYIAVNFIECVTFVTTLKQNNYNWLKTIELLKK